MLTCDLVVLGLSAVRLRLGETALSPSVASLVRPLATTPELREVWREAEAAASWLKRRPQVPEAWAHARELQTGVRAALTGWAPTSAVNARADDKLWPKRSCRECSASESAGRWRAIASVRAFS